MSLLPGMSIIVPRTPTEGFVKKKKEMRKYLEVLVDDDGRFHFSTEEAEDQTSNPKEFDKEFKQLLGDLTEFMWKNKTMAISQVIRKISMAEVIATVQPYEQAESFWENMMFHTIPQYENFAAKIKKPYGFDNRAVVRPITGTPGTSIFPIKTPFGKNWN